MNLLSILVSLSFAALGYSQACGVDPGDDVFGTVAGTCDDADPQLCNVDGGQQVCSSGSCQTAV